MSNKPLANPTAFTGQAPPWSLTQLDANFTAIQNTINDTLTYSNYFVDQSGVANSVILSIPTTLTVALTAGTLLYVKIANTSTAAVTITINALAAQSVVNPDGSALPAGALLAGAIAALAYDGTNFQLLVTPSIRRTGAEITAGVTPVNSQYPEGYVDRYGNNTTPGTTDMTTAIKNAYLVAKQNNSTREVRFLGNEYLVTDTAISIATSEAKIAIRGVPLRTVLTNKAGASKPTIKLVDAQIWDIRGLVFKGAATFPNVGIQVDTAGGQRSGFGYMRDIVCVTNGGGIHLIACNTITIENFTYWPSGQNWGATNDGNTALPYGILADGATAVNGIYLKNINIGNLNLIANDATAAGIKIDGSTSASTYQEWDVHGLEMEIVGARALWARQVNIGSFRHMFTENSELRFDDGCVRCSLEHVEAAATGTIVVDSTQAKGACGMFFIYNSQAKSLTVDATNYQFVQIGNNWSGAGGNADSSINSTWFNVQTTGSVLVADKVGSTKGFNVAAGFGTKRIVVTYSAAMNIDASLGTCFDIVATNGNAFTVNKAVNPVQDGQTITITIGNGSGGALGAITFAAGYQMETFTAPANGKYRAMTFRYDSNRTTWDELSFTANDITR